MTALDSASHAPGTSTISGAGESVAASHHVRQLRVVFGAQALGMRAIPLTGQRIVLGREPGAAANAIAIAIAGNDVSRHHATIELAGEAWHIVDNASRNGTFANGVAVSGRTALRNGSVIRIGGALLVFQDGEMPAGRQRARTSLIGHSPPIARIRSEIELVAPSPVSVVIHGETGVGKELVAAEIHRASRRNGAFVAVNCATIPGSLAESELFGHTVGAFTGAVSSHDGLFLAAQGGTLFLDEIGEMPLEIQAKLLRALALKEIRPVGANHPVRVDVRIIAATHRALEDEVAAGRFRADLFARLAGWQVVVPPLRERREDILLLADELHARTEGGARGRKLELTAHTAEALLLHNWPYNVRELEQVIAVSAVRAGGGVIRLEHLPGAIAARLGARSTGSPSSIAMPDPNVLPDRDALERVLRHCDGNVAEVARHFGKDRRQIYRWLSRYELSPWPRSGDAT